MFADVSLVVGVNVPSELGKDACPLAFASINALFSCFLYTTDESLCEKETRDGSFLGCLAALNARVLFSFCLLWHLM